VPLSLLKHLFLVVRAIVDVSRRTCVLKLRGGGLSDDGFALSCV